MLAAMPPIVEHNASSTGTDVVGYLTEGPGFSTFTRDDDTVYHAYSTTARGLEFLMGYYRSSTAHRMAAGRARRLSSGSAARRVLSASRTGHRSQSARTVRSS